MPSSGAVRPVRLHAGLLGPQPRHRQRRLHAKIAANARWSKYMAREDQADAARAAIFARLERQVDPNGGDLPPDQRAALVRAAGREPSARLNAAKAPKRAMRNE